MLVREKREFNVCLIAPTGYLHAFALVEAAEYVLWSLRALGHVPTLTKNRLTRGATNIVFGAHLCADQLIENENDIIIFNTEQIPAENSPWNNPSYTKMLERHSVWDYSQKNLDLIPSDRKFLVNFGYCPQLKRLALAEQKQFDLIFYGSMNESRRKIILELRARGLKVESLFGAYGKTRDELISRSRAVLNLNFYPTAIYPQIRNFYPLTNGVPVISESWSAGSAPHFHETAVFSAPPDLFVDYVYNVMRDSHKFNRESDKRLAKFRDHKDESLERALGNMSSQCKYSRSGLESWSPKRLNLGSGKDYKFNYLNIDINPEARPDLITDLSIDVDLPVEFKVGKTKLVLDENQFDEIVANDVLEHVSDLQRLMTNCLKLLKPNGIFKIKVPYDLSYGAWQDPTHVRAFNEKSWLYYTEWFWYLGWSNHRFSMEKLQFDLSPLGKKLFDSGEKIDQILTLPRAVDSMYVELKKIMLTEADKSALSAWSNNLDAGGVTHRASSIAGVDE